MEQEKEFTFEDLVKLDQELSLTDLTTDHSTAISALSLPTIPQLCPIYRKIRPFIAAISSIPFIPANVKAAVKTLISILDTLCP